MVVIETFLYDNYVSGGEGKLSDMSRVK